SSSSKKEKKTFMIDFFENVEIPISSSVNANKIVSGLKKSNLLPEDVHYDISMLMKPFYIPQVRMNNNTKSTMNDDLLDDEPVDEPPLLVPQVDTQMIEETTIPQMDEETKQVDIQMEEKIQTKEIIGTLQPTPIPSTVLANSSLNVLSTIPLIEAPQQVEKLKIDYAKKEK